MNRETILILIEIMVAIVLALVVDMVVFFFGVAYETTSIVKDFGKIGIMLSLPLGGVMGAYLVRKLHSTSSQKISSAVWVGFLVGITILFLIAIFSAIFFTNS